MVTGDFRGKDPKLKLLKSEQRLLKKVMLSGLLIGFNTQKVLVSEVKIFLRLFILDNLADAFLEGIVCLCDFCYLNIRDLILERDVKVTQAFL